MHKTREMHTTTNYLLANLAVSDVIIIFTIPVHFANLSEFTCRFKVIGDIAHRFISLNSFSYGCRKVSRFIETFQIEFALKRGEYQESNCSYLDIKHSLRFSRIFP